MKRRNVLGLVVVLLSTFLFTGCGPKLVELTASERQQIINYAAHVVSEFNLRQEKGYLALSAEVLEALNGDKTEEEENRDETDNKDENVKDEENTGKDEGTSSDKDDSVSSTLTAALGISGIEAKIKSYEVADNYSEGGVANVNPGKSCRLVVVNCVLTNGTQKDVLCDMAEREIKFFVEIAGKRIENLETILTKDLSTMNDTIAAGESVEMVILFEITDKQAESLGGIRLIVKNGSTNHTISMN